MKDIIKKVLIVIIIILILFAIFGVIDYYRSTIGKKPIFIYNKATNSSYDVEIVGLENAVLNGKEGTTYYGIGYNISVCDNNTKNYIFHIGNKKAKPCYSVLNCNTSEKGTLVLNDDYTVSYNVNDKDDYEYTFFEDKLIKVKATLTRPVSSIKNIETFNEEIKNFYNEIPGCDGMGYKISEEAYKTIIVCVIPKMSTEDIKKYLPVRSEALLNYTKDEIINYHEKDLKCK